MNRSKPGVLTIEAAITLPLVIIAIVSILFFAKVYYIQDQIHSAMTKAVHDMSIDAYVVDKIGVLDLQQDLYIEGITSLNHVESAAISVGQSSSLVLMDEANMTDFGGSVVGWFGDVEGLSSEGDFGDIASDALRLIGEGPALVEGIAGNIFVMIEGLQVLYKEASASMGSIALMEAVDFGNGIVADQMGSAAFYQYISEEQLQAWDITSDVGTIDFSMSSYMLVDDTVTLVSDYNIAIPFGNAWLGDTIPVLQKVTARAWTGSYDAGEIKNRQELNGEGEIEAVYYISTGDADNHAYHFYSCLRKPLIKSTYEEEVILKNRDVCHFCKDHYNVTDDDMMVYYVNASSKVHLFHQCYTVYAQGVIAVTEDEAINQFNRTPCKKYHCVAQSKGQDE